MLNLFSGYGLWIVCWVLFSSLPFLPLAGCLRPGVEVGRDDGRVSKVHMGLMVGFWMGFCSVSFLDCLGSDSARCSTTLAVV